MILPEERILVKNAIETNDCARNQVRRLGMQKAKTRLTHDIPLFRTCAYFGPDLETRPTAGDLELLLALHGMDFLRYYEKTELLDSLARKEDFLSLRLDDIERIVLRRLNADRWRPAESLEKASRFRELLSHSGIKYINILESAYPPQLREIYKPPFGLFVRGNLPNPEVPSVAIVGTRIPTGRGIAAAFRIAKELSNKGIAVVSGLARGIDTAAHRGAVERIGGTLAVLPCGPERIYPSANRALASVILDSGGAIVTEYLPYSPMDKYRFPDRNRLIAGLARSCLVVEAPEGSGALITSDHALSEGRDVYVHGDCLGSSRNAGADALANQGARVVYEARDIEEDWISRGERLKEAYHAYC
jgi:DNA processing protein